MGNKKYSFKYYLNDPTFWLEINFKNVRVYNDGEIIDKINAINGVVRCSVYNAYKLDVFKADLYTWDEIKDSIDELLISLGLEKV